jgi:hypothetical protein
MIRSSPEIYLSVVEKSEEISYKRLKSREMDICIEMAISYLLFLAFIIIDFGEAQNVCPQCGGRGPIIQFPFQLNHGHSGFNLSCTDTNDTVLELPNAVKLLVKKIDYNSQVIQLQDPGNCFPRSLRGLNLSSLPFQFKLEDPSSYLQNYTLFKCSPRLEKMDYEYDMISCLRESTYQVYPATYISASLLSCTKMYNLVSIPGGIIEHHDKYVQLKWQFNSSESGTRCIYYKPNEGILSIQ